MATDIERIPPDLTVRSSAYGQIMPIPYGSVRVTGNIIWATDLIEESTTGSIYDSTNTTTLTTDEYAYFGTFAVSLSDCEIEAVEKIWADGKLVYDGLLADQGNLLTNGDMESWTGATIDTWTTSGTVAQESTIVDPDIEDSAYSIKLSTGASASTVYLEQSFTPASTNQHHFRVRAYCPAGQLSWARLVVSIDGTNYEPWFRVPTGRWTTIEGDFTPANTSAKTFRLTTRDVANANVYIDSVSVVETSSNALEGDSTNFKTEIFLGTEEQTASSIITSNHPFGSAYVPAYRGQAYVVFEKMPLKSFGNKIPKIEAQIQSYEKAVKDMIEDVCSRVGLDSGQYNVSDMSDIFTGMVTTSERTGEDLLNTINDASPFAVRESDLRVYFNSLASLTSSRSFDEDDLDARDSSDEPDTALTIDIDDEALLPVEVSITAFDPSRNQQESTQRAKTFRVSVGTKKSFHWTIVASADQIRQCADILLMRAWLESRKFAWSYGSDNLDLQCGDVITISRGDEDITIRITNIELGAMGRLVCSGVEYSQDCFDSDSIGATNDSVIEIPATV